MGDARLVDIVRHGAGAPDLIIRCCDAMDPQVTRAGVWRIACGSCGANIAHIIKANP